MIKEIPEGLRLPVQPKLKAGADKEEAEKILSDVLGISEQNPLRMIKTPLESIALRWEWVKYIAEKHSQHRERQAAYIIPALEDPLEIWQIVVKSLSGKRVLRHRYICPVAGKKDLVVVLHVNKDGGIDFYNMMRKEMKGLDNQRVGELLYIKREK
ncbi:MAG: hypothetical protein HQL72_09285 [Magnetococcales bacterium]|nr:hypothetical protein [Magnetococcales bacterium]